MIVRNQARNIMRSWQAWVAVVMSVVAIPAAAVTFDWVTVGHPQISIIGSWVRLDKPAWRSG
jgi:hypothetical protein